MQLIDRYQDAVHSLFKKVEDTQREPIIECGKLFADTVANGGHIFLSAICHHIDCLCIIIADSCL